MSFSRQRTLYFFIPIAVVLLFIVPLVSPSPYLIRLLIYGYIFSLLAVSWDAPFAYAGIVTLGTSLAFGLGGLLFAILNLKFNINVYIAALLSIIIVTIFAGIFVGFLCLRLRGPYLVIVTVALANAARFISISKYGYSITGGEEGLSGFHTLVSGITENYYLSLVVMLFCLLVLYLIVKSKIGLSLFCIHEDEISAESIGINVSRCRLVAITISAFFGAISGLLYASCNSHIDAWGLSFDITFLSLAMALIGGSGTIAGPVLGSLIITFLQEYLRWIGIWRMLLYGLIVLTVTFVRPQGILGPFRRKILAWKLSEKKALPFSLTSFRTLALRKIKMLNERLKITRR